MNKKRGQVAVFVIIAILIVVLVLLFFLLKGKVLPNKLGGEVFSPEGYLESCITPYIKETLKIQSNQGGFIVPEGFLEFNNEKISYLCYTNEYYKTCVVQKPMIKSQVEQELKRAIIPKAKACAESLINEYKKKGYQINSKEVDADISIIPGKISVSFISPITITKETSTQKFDRFDIGIKSEMYDLLLISDNIVSFESEFGDSETTSYIQYYPNLKIDKNKLSDGSKIYTLSNSLTNESFRFASRSLVWPPGYSSP